MASETADLPVYETGGRFDKAIWKASTLFDAQRVIYAVGDIVEPLSRLYFCKYCYELRCENSDLIQTEIDSHFCMHALDNLPTTEAILKKNKSRSFWQCPACPSILCHKTKSVIMENPDKPDAPIMKKYHFMLCSFCHWSTRDVGMVDAVAAGAWPEKENANATRINEIYEHVKQVSSNQAFMARSKSNKRISTRITGKMSSLSPMLINLSMKDGKPVKVSELENPKARGLEDFDPVDDEFLTETGVNFWNTTSLQQRLDQPEFQPEFIKDLYPRRLTMGVKRSLRCRPCEHNLLKPEFSPSSMKFKMHLIATSYIPEIRLLTAPKWTGSETDVTFTVTNPTHSPISVIMLPFCDVVENRAFPELCGKVTLPTDSYEIPPKDTLAEFECSITSDGTDDGVIRFTQPNKLGFKCHVTLSGDQEETGDRWVALRLKHDYIDTLGHHRDKPNPVWITHTVFINLKE